MKIIIAGAGDVGFHLAKLLAKENQDIFLIDLDNDKLEYAKSHIDVITFLGNATSPSVLAEVNVGKSDLFIAATSSEDTNIVASLIGKKMGAKQSIARVQNLEFLLKDRKIDLAELGIDFLIAPKQLLTKEIVQLIDQSAATDSYDFGNGQLSMIGITLAESSPLLDRSIDQTASLNPELDFIPIAIHRDNATIIPRGQSVFQLKDHVYFISKKSGLRKILNLSGSNNLRIKNVMILGGGMIGSTTASRLEKKYAVKLIEKRKTRCLNLAEKLPSTLIINADGRDVEALEEEGIADMQAFIALTGDSETNIISCLVAKNHGVQKTIALVDNIDYINISQNIGIDTLLNRKLIAANDIFRFIRRGEISSIIGLHGVDAEIIEYVAKAGSRITEKMIKDLDICKEALIGGVIRDEKGLIVNGDFKVMENDHVVVFCLPAAIKKVEKLFD